MTILVNEFWWCHSLEAIPKANFIASDNVYVLFNSMESFGESKTINTRSNNKTYIEKIVFVWPRAKKKKTTPKHIYLFVTEFIVLCWFWSLCCDIFFFCQQEWQGHLRHTDFEFLFWGDYSWFPRKNRTPQFQQPNNVKIWKIIWPSNIIALLLNPLNHRKNRTLLNNANLKWQKAHFFVPTD